MRPLQCSQCVSMLYPSDHLTKFLNTNGPFKGAQKSPTGSSTMTYYQGVWDKIVTKGMITNVSIWSESVTYFYTPHDPYLKGVYNSWRPTFLQSFMRFNWKYELYSVHKINMDRPKTDARRALSDHHTSILKWIAKMKGKC